MQGEKEKVRDVSEGSGQQPSITPQEEPNPVGQDSARNEYGEIGEKAPPGSGAEPRRSMGTHGDEFGQMSDHDRSGQQGQSGTGQADLGSQAGSMLSGHADQQELSEAGGEVDQPASYVDGRQSEIEGDGFILKPEARPDERPPRESPASAEATQGSDFATQGRGAPEPEDEASSEDGVG